MKSKLRLLIVDDDARMRELATFAAQRATVFETVRTAADGAAALEWLSQCGEAELPDAILTDLNMPRVNGVELARRLHEHPRWREIPVAMFSSSTPPDEDPLALGCRAFFMKPVDLADLTQLMTSVAELADSGSAVPH